MERPFAQVIDTPVGLRTEIIAGRRGDDDGVPAWTITETPVHVPSARAILREYLTDIASRYWGRPATETEVDQALREGPSDDLVAPGGAFLLAQLADGTTAGCVGTRVVRPGLNELTRLYVRPSWRGQGGGRQLVAAAEAAARALGARTIRLDTRTDLVEARALYASAGYTEVEPFNDDQYAHHWFAKTLA